MIVLSVVGYVGCYGSFLLQDRREHHEVVAEVEAVTRTVVTADIAHGRQDEARAKLNDAKVRLDEAESRWQRDARHLLLLSSAN